MSLRSRAVCAVCGVAFMGAAIAHVCIADLCGQERRQEVVIITPAPIEVPHHERPPDPRVNYALLARQIEAVQSTGLISSF